MFEISITDNNEEILKRFDNLENKLSKELSSIIDDVASKIKFSIEEDLQVGYAYGTMNKTNGKPYYSSGKLYKSIDKQKVNNNEYNIMVNADRMDVAKYLYYGTEKMIARPWFRISPDISKYIDDKITTLIK